MKYLYYVRVKNEFLYFKSRARARANKQMKYYYFRHRKRRRRNCSVRERFLFFSFFSKRVLRRFRGSLVSARTRTPKCRRTCRNTPVVAAANGDQLLVSSRRPSRSSCRPPRWTHVAVTRARAQSYENLECFCDDASDARQRRFFFYYYYYNIARKYRLYGGVFLCWFFTSDLFFRFWNACGFTTMFSRARKTLLYGGRGKKNEEYTTNWNIPNTTIIY